MVASRCCGGSSTIFLCWYAHCCSTKQSFIFILWETFVFLIFPTLPEQPPPSLPLPPLLPPLYDNIPCTIMYVWSSHHRHHQPHNSIQSPPPPPPPVKDVVHMREKLKPLSFLYAAAQQYKALDRLASRSGSSIGGGGGCSIMLSLC